MDAEGASYRMNAEGTCDSMGGNMTTAIELDRMVAGCIKKLDEAGYKVWTRFSKISYDFVFAAERNGVLSSFRFTVEEQMNGNYDNFFKWVEELLNPAKRK